MSSSADPPNPAPATTTPQKHAERPALPRAEIVLGFLVLVAASVPYLYGWFATPPGHVFTGFTYNMDDCAVYLAWMRQVSDGGQFFQHNPFTTDGEKAVLFNAFFLLLGGLARITHLPLLAVYHLARVGFGGLFLWAGFRFIREAVADERTRHIAFALLCFASGVGWLMGGYDAGRAYEQPVDLWQPEAIPFLSVYYTPLFSAALGAICVFAASVVRAEKTKQLRDIWPACLMGLLLGNFHSYDIIPLFLAWGTFRVLSDGLARRIDAGGWARLVLAGLATLPTVAYQVYAVQADPVFRARALVSTTSSPSLRWILLGLGVPLVLAVCAPCFAPVRAAFANQAALRFLCVWAVVGVACVYLPFAFQRKLLMGAFVPVSVLGGATLAALCARLPGSFPRLAAFFAVLLTSVSNGLWLMQDIGRVGVNVGSTARRPYFTNDEWAALQWLHDHSKPSEAVLVGPDPASHKRFPFFPLEAHLAPYVPAFAGNTVYNGHWSETPDYGQKRSRALRFFAADTPDEMRRELLTQNRIRYVLYLNALGDGPIINPATGQAINFLPVAWPARDVPPYLVPAFQSREVTIYAVATAAP